MSAADGTRGLALLGGPESGKTTFLGALALELELGEDDLGADGPALTLHNIGRDARGLRRLAQPLRGGDYPQRTKEERQALDLELSARLRPGDPSTPFRLRVADYDGEEIERLFRDRTAPTLPEWQDRARADGLLLFFRQGAFKPLPPLRRPAAVSQKRGLLLPRAADDVALVDEFPPTPLSGDPGKPKVPTVLALIEMLQYLRALRGLRPSERPPEGQLRIALLVSAWDLIDPAAEIPPSHYLREQAPLLVDYLWSNHREDDFRCFGLSSTGGDLSDAAQRARYRRAPSGHVCYLDGGSVVRRPQLSLPILWTLFGDAALRRA